MVKPIPLVLVVYLAFCHGLPQLFPGNPDGSSAGVPADLSGDPTATSALASPWSQWMSLKAPPIGLAKPKKKLLPGPPPPEGTPEAPWVSWTRMKVSSALAPPLPPPIPLSPPALAQTVPPNTPTDDSATAPEQAIWIQWTQMKLPLTTPFAPTTSSAQETPWDAWTKMKSPMASLPAGPGVPVGSSITKRMAPDRYSIASTVAPRINVWPINQREQVSDQFSAGWGQSETQQSSSSPSLLTSRMSSAASTQPTQWPDLSPSTKLSPNVQQQLFYSNSNYMYQVSPTRAQSLAPPIYPVPWSAGMNPVLPQTVTKLTAGKNTMVPPSPNGASASFEASILKTIPQPILTEISTKATPAELYKITEKISLLNKAPMVSGRPIVGDIIPPTLVAKLSPQLLPLLTKPVTLPLQRAAAPADIISVLPEPVLKEALAKATLLEVVQLGAILSKLEKVPPEEKAVVKNLQVSALLPPTLTPKLSPEVAPLLKNMLLPISTEPPAILQSAIPEPVLTQILETATVKEIVTVTERLAKLEEISPAPSPPLAAILPPLLAARLPSTILPLVNQKLILPPAPASTLSAIPAPVMKEILATATPKELVQLVENLEMVKESTTAMVPTLGKILPPSLVAKLPPTVTPLLAHKIKTPIAPVAPSSISPLVVIPPPVMNEILTKTTAAELKEITENVKLFEKVKDAAPLLISPKIKEFLPPSLIPKLSPEATAVLKKLIVGPADVVSPTDVKDVVEVFSTIPEPLLTTILKIATPKELAEIKENIPPLQSKAPVKEPVFNFLPPTLITKIPSSVAALLTTEVVIPPKAPVQQLTLPLVAPIVSILPELAVKPVLTVASLEELKEVAIKVEQLESLTPTQVEQLPKLTLASILPPTLIPKLPAEVKSLLANEITVPVKATLLTETVPSIAEPIPLDKVIPEPILTAVLTAATPKELTEIVTTVVKVDTLTPEELAVLPELEVGSILPPSLIVKLPPAILPLLASTKIPSKVKAIPADVTSIVSVIPKPILSEILEKATPEEITRVVDAIELAKSIPATTLDKLPKLTIASVLPSTLLPKISPTLLPLLATDIKKEIINSAILPEIKPVIPQVPKPLPLGVVEPVPSPAVDILSLIPEPVLNEVLAKASPEELTELEQTVESLQVLPPEMLPKLSIANILPPTLLPKLPSAIEPLLKTELKISPVNPLAPPTPELGLSPVTVATILSVIPEPILNEVLAKAAPEEFAEITQMVDKLEKMTPAELAALPRTDMTAILPASLVAKLPPDVETLVHSKFVLPPAVAFTTPPSPIPVGMPIPLPTLSTIASIIPEPVLSEVLIKATPTELAELVSTMNKLETIPAEQLPGLEVAAILPPSVIPKLSPEVLPLLKIAIPPIPTTVPPAQLVSIPPADVVAIASVIPEALLTDVLTEATPAEITELVSTIEQLEKIPADQLKALPPLEVAALLPPTLVAKLPAEAVPLLKSPVIIPSPPVPSIIPTPALGPAISLPVLTTIATILPEVVLGEVLTKASPAELTQLVSTVEQLETIPPQQLAALSGLEITDILPPSVIPKLSLEVAPLLKTKIVIPTTSEVLIPSAMASIPSIDIGKIASVIPEAILADVLTEATPEEIIELASTIEKIEAIPPEQLKGLPALEVAALLPATLIAKLSPETAPILKSTLTLPIVTVTTPLATPSPDIDILASVIPEPILSEVVAKATPSEITEFVKNLKALEDIPKDQMATLPKLDIVDVIPPVLADKLAPEIISLLSSTELVLPHPKIPAPIPNLSTMQIIPEPILSQILAVATPEELSEIVETVSTLETVVSEQKPLAPKVEIANLLPPSVISKLPLTVAALLAQDIVIPPAEKVKPSEEPWLEYIKSEYGIPDDVPVESPIAPPIDTSEVPVTPAEEKILTKWAKVILDKTGKPGPSLPGDLPPLQAAWMEWVQLQVNETEKASKQVAPVTPETSTTEYPWTQWLKLKETESTEPVPSLDVNTESPEKNVLNWLDTLDKPPVIVTPEMEEKVAQLLKEAGIENVSIPPEQVLPLLAELEKMQAPVAPAVASPNALPAPFLATISYQPFWPPPTSPYLPYYSVNPYLPPRYPPIVTSPGAVPGVESTPMTLAAPSLNLTEYLITNNMIPQAAQLAQPSSAISIPSLANVLENQALSTPNISTTELASLTPTKFASLLKQILKDCNRTNVVVTRSSRSHKKKGGKGKGKPSPYSGSGYNNGWQGDTAGNEGYGSYRGKRAIFPIPSQAFTPASSQEPGTNSDTSVTNLFPMPSLSMPKVETSGTVLDPAYWAAQKSMFLSKLFSTLAKVALNDSAVQTTTANPKDQLTKQVNSVLLSDFTRSIKHKPKFEEEDEDEDEYESEEKQQDVNENELVTNDNSEPDLPKEPKNPLHKLFKFGVQKTVLSDSENTTLAPQTKPLDDDDIDNELVTAPPSSSPLPQFAPTPPHPLEPRRALSLAKQKELIDKLKSEYEQNKIKDKKMKKKLKSANKNRNHQHKSRFRDSKPTTTENPIDFELLAKALLVDNNAKK